MNARQLCLVMVLSFVSPAVAIAQGTGIGVSVQGAIGSHFGDGGDTQSVSLAVSFGEHFGVVVPEQTRRARRGRLRARPRRPCLAILIR